MTQNSAFRVVGVEEEVPQPTPQENAAAIKMLQIAISALWQRFVTAIAECFILFAGGSVFTLYMTAPPDPTPRQLVMFGMYAGFALLASGLVYWGRRR